jgi:3-(3-hydroxy-phenyl)propionate hydroxylase
MMSSRQYQTYPYRPANERPGHRHKVAIVGAGPVGLAAAIDLAQHGVECVVLDEDDTVSVGSRAICWAKRTLEIFDRLGAVQPMMAKGITWHRGRVFHGDRELYSFDLLPEPDHEYPAFINLQQYYVEEALVARCAQLPEIDLRWRHKLVGLRAADDATLLDVETPDGTYALAAQFLIAADGARSSARRLLGLEFEGRVFEDRFLISDVRMKADFPTERWFWFAPPFHPGPSALLHRQADDIWRIDLQLGADVDPEEEKKPERVIPRLKAMLGPDRPFELEWVSVYRFQCRMLDRFRHGRVIFVGDSAHQVSPFGARGGNSGIQDADNLCWKLALVLAGQAPDALLDTYDRERAPAARENIRVTTATTDFMSAKGASAMAFRDAVLELAETTPCARAFVNSGRLSLPAILHGSSLDTPDRDEFSGSLVPGAPAADAPIERAGKPDWLLDELGGTFALIVFGDTAAAKSAIDSLLPHLPPLRLISIDAVGKAGQDLTDVKGIAFRRYDAEPGSAYLLRPDQHVAARWRKIDAAAFNSAFRRALGFAETTPLGMALTGD